MPMPPVSGWTTPWQPLGSPMRQQREGGVFWGVPPTGERVDSRKDHRTRRMETVIDNLQAQMVGVREEMAMNQMVHKHFDARLDQLQSRMEDLIALMSSDRVDRNRKERDMSEEKVEGELEGEKQGDDDEAEEAEPRQDEDAEVQDWESRHVRKIRVGWSGLVTIRSIRNQRRKIIVWQR